MIRYLDLNDLAVIAARVLGIEAAVAANVMNVVLADSALHAPQVGFGGVEFYPNLATKVAVLGYRLARNHALPDGNKRTAFLAMITFARLNGCAWAPLNEEGTVGTMLAVASGAIDEDTFISWVADRLELPG